MEKNKLIEKFKIRCEKGTHNPLESLDFISLKIEETYHCKKYMFVFLLKDIEVSGFSLLDFDKIVEAFDSVLNQENNFSFFSLINNKVYVNIHFSKRFGVE